MRETTLSMNLIEDLKQPNNDPGCLLPIGGLNYNYNLCSNRILISIVSYSLLTLLGIDAGAAELSYDAWHMKESLHRCHIQLNTKVLANMAIWEPRTFRSGTISTNLLHM